MKLNKNFIVHEEKGEQILVAMENASFHGIVRNNKVAAFIVNQLQNDVTKEQIVQAVFDEYDAPKETIAQDVDKVLDSLRKIGAIDE